MKIAIFEAEGWEREAFEPLADEHQLVFADQPLDNGTAHNYNDAQIISTFIYSTLHAHVLEQFPHLKLIATRSTGFDHIDTRYCERTGVQVCNVPTYGQNTVAEHVFALLLTISHNIVNAVERTRKGDFSLTGLRGFDLQGKTIGVIGTGNIGRHVVSIAKGFSMEVLAHDIKEDQELAQQLGFSYTTLEDLLGRSDVVTLHVPMSDETKHMIGQDQFEQMKDGAVLINTSRGGLVHVKSLVRALADGTIAAAGLDVLPEEPIIREEAELLRSAFKAEHDLETLLADHILLRLRNVYITPHSAFDTREAVRRILDTTVSNIQAFCRGKPENVVAGANAAGKRETEAV